MKAGFGAPGGWHCMVPAKEWAGGVPGASRLAPATARPRPLIALGCADGAEPGAAGWGWNAGWPGHPRRGAEGGGANFFISGGLRSGVAAPVPRPSALNTVSIVRVIAKRQKKAVWMS